MAFDRRKWQQDERAERVKTGRCRECGRPATTERAPSGRGRKPTGYRCGHCRKGRRES